MTDIRTQTIQRLIERRRLLQDAYDGIIAEPSSVSIIGSVSYTNRNLSELQKELETVNAQIASLLTGTSSIIRRSYPNYQCGEGVR